MKDLKTNLFKEYRDVKDQLKYLEERKEALETAIFDELDADGREDKSTPFGFFKIMGRKTYEYSPKITALQLELSNKKKIEELKGIATLKSDSRYLRLVIDKTEGDK
jgi:hypothetical protein